MLRSDFPLAPLQERMLDYLDSDPKAKLFATQGARKTQTVLCHIETHGFKRPLIICLKDNIKTWSDEMEKWLPNPQYTQVRGTAATKRKRIEAHLKSDTKKYLIMGYDTAKPSSLYKDGEIVDGKKNKKMENFLRRKANEFDIVVFDESCEISKHTSARFKSLYKIARDIPNRIVMDGDPTAEGLDKVFSQFWMADDGATFGTAYYKFRDVFYHDIGPVFPKWVLRPGAVAKMGKILRTKAFVVTEKDLDKEIGLPSRNHEVIYPEMTAEQSMHYKRMKKEFATKVEDLDIEVSYIMEQITKLRQILGGFIYTKEGTKRLLGVKERVLRKLVRRHQSSQIVVWCAYTEEIHIVYDILKHAGRNPVKYYGDVSNKAKDEAKDGFNSGTYSDIVCQGGCGVGLNEFVVADTMIYYSNTDRRRHRSQSEKRVIRPTQKAKSVNVYDIVIPETWDELIYTRLQDKKKTSEQLLNYKEWKLW